MESGRFLDVGCGEGFEMKFMAEAGWSVRGIDFSEEGMKNHNHHLLSCLSVGPIDDSLDSLLSLGQEFDCIYLGNILEHEPEPEYLLSRVLSLLSKNGLVIVRVPNDFSPLQISLIEAAKARDKYWVSIPEHLNYFSFSSLEQVLASAGFALLDYFSSFPIDWFVANEGSNYVQKPELGKYAHMGRIFLDDIIFKNNDLEDVLSFYRGLCGVGMGRNITVVASAK